MADCAPFDIKCKAAGAISDLSQGFWGDFEKWVVDSAAEGMKLAVAGWIQLPTPTIDSDSGPVAYLIAYTYPIAFVLATVSLLIMAGRIAWSQRSEEFVDLGRSLLTFVALTTLGVATVAALTAAGDSYSRWIIDSSVGLGPGASDTQLGERVVVTLGIAEGNPATSGLTGLVLVLAFGWLAFTSIVLTLLTYLRGVILLVLAGLLPVAAALGINPGGRQTLGRYLAWAAAWVAFKPATATVIATGFWMVGTGDSLDAVGGIALLGMTIFMLPFLLRLFVPAAAAFGGGSGAGAGAVGAAAAGAVSLAALGSRPGGDDGASSPMSVRDVSQGSRPSGSAAALSAGPNGGPAGGRGAGDAGQPAAAGGGAAANAGAGAAAAGSGAAAGTAGGGAAGGGAAAAGAAGGPAGMAVAAGVQAGTQVAQAGAQAARGAAGAATGEESS